MSLQLAAKHLESHGRGDDKVLVHMTHGEVKSLNDLAMAHGGQLTINPKTGLPEAGFLRAILPMVAGAALTGLSGGALSPLAASLIVGGGYTAASGGDLKKGLMAGLGAYGGAGLGEALAQQGMQVAASASPEVLTAQQNAVSNAATLGNSAANYTPEIFAEAARATTAPIDVARESAFKTAQTQFAAPTTSFTDRLSTMGQGVKSLGTEGGFSNLTQNLGGGYRAATTAASALAPTILQEPEQTPTPAVDKDMGQRYTYSAGQAQPLPAPDVPSYDAMLTQQGDFGRQQNYYPNQRYTPISNEQAKGIYGYANGGTVEDMSNRAMMGINTMYPMANVGMPSYIAPNQRMAKGGISDLGDYSDGGRLLRGPGDGVSDSIPAMIGKKQPARLADGEFVVPARIVSEIGNGSTEAGARKLYAMMDRIQSARGKTVGKGKVAKNTRADKYLPA